MLLRSPETYKKLVEEIRGAFKSYDEIDGIASDRLPYLKSCIEETLRIYPVVPFGLPRLSPGETVDGVYVPQGVCFQGHIYTSRMSYANKTTHRPRYSHHLTQRHMTKTTSKTQTNSSRSVGWTLIRPTRRRRVSHSPSAPVSVLGEGTLSASNPPF